MAAFVAFALTVLLLTGLSVLGFEMLSAARGYVGGESLWSKAQKRAVSELEGYAATGEERHWNGYLEALRVPLGDRQARRELQSANPDLGRARRGFLRGEIPPEDIDGMIRLFQLFGDWEPMARAVRIWETGDSLIAELHEEATRARLARIREGGNAAAVDTALTAVRRLDRQLTEQERAFTAVMGDAAQRSHGWIRNALIVMALLLLLAGGVGSWVVYRLLRKRDRELRRSEARYRNIVRDSRDAIYVTSRDGTIEEMNPAGLALFGYEEMRGMNARELYHDPEDREVFRERIAEDGSVEGFEVELETRDGEVRHCLLSSTERREDGTLVGYQGIIRDVTERKEFERRLQHRAMHDPLTELPNRALFWDRLEQALSRLRRRGGGAAVLFVDLDAFKKINDSLGHTAGDRVLVAVAERLRRSIREPDTVARLGGDEFGVLIEELEAPAGAEEVAERVLACFASPVPLDGHEAHLSASVGVALVGPAVGKAGAAGLDPDELVRQADVAMYRGKAAPGCQVRIYEPEADRAAGGRLQRENELRGALEDDEMVVHYQPVFDLLTGDAVAVEPLVRWRHSDGKLRSPTDFLALAIETGLIRRLGHFVLRDAIGRAAAWNAALPEGRELRVHPNSSASEFEAPDFVERMEDWLAEFELRPELVCVEITEQVALSGVERVRDLRELGVRIAIDDFGTGYSSLTHVKRLEVDVLKVDRSFVAGLGRDRTDEAIVKTILTLAEELGFSVVAEGVETPEQRRWLEERGCPAAQGYLLGRPVPAAELAASLGLDAAERSASGVDRAGDA